MRAARGNESVQGAVCAKDELADAGGCSQRCGRLRGLSVKGAFTQEMLRSMAARPIVFAMANPDPEITYEDALASTQGRAHVYGRTDYPNQVNNVPASGLFSAAHWMCMQRRLMKR